MIDYLALGDSYTIGTSVPGRDSFPAQLAERLEAATGVAVRVVNLGVNGYTTADLIRDELPQAQALRPTLATCLIGVNDFVQGVDAASYREALTHIYAAMKALGLESPRGVAVSIPDFSYTPAARLYGDPARIAGELRARNALAAVEARAAGLAFVDIFEASRAGAGSPGWLADDGLHPARVQYAAWVECIWAEVGSAWVDAAVSAR